MLVVDDEFGVAELFDAILTSEGHRVLTAINGKHGLEVLAQELADLLFLDLMMPVMDGGMMLEAMMADPAYRTIPVVMMSPVSEATIAKWCSGYAAFMRKPFKVAELMNLAERLVGQSVSPRRVTLARSELPGWP